MPGVLVAKYADLTSDVSDDPAISVTEDHLAQADVFIDLSLAERGFTQAEIDGLTLPITALTTIAVAWAKRLACIDGAIGEQSPLLDKAKQFEKTAQILVSKLTRESLGIEALDTSGFGFFGIERA